MVLLPFNGVTSIKYVQKIESESLLIGENKSPRLIVLQ